MKKNLIIAIGIALLPLSGFSAEKNLDPLDQWAQWRGPLGTGVAPRGNPPLEWSEEKNIRWKTSINGKGQSTPVIWGNHILITTAEEYGDPEIDHYEEPHGAHGNMDPLRKQKFIVMDIGRSTGKIRWQKIVSDERPHESTHTTGSWASHSVVTDGERLFAYFGSRGIYCLDMNGELQWKKDLGDKKVLHGHGEGSSPALHGDSLIINWDHEGESFVIVLDKKTGRKRWKASRDEISSWSTPLVVEHGGKTQVIISATKRVRAYDLSDGSVLWECGGLSQNVVASPVSADGFVYVGSSYRIQSMFAVRLEGAKGDITGTDAVAWGIDSFTPYVPSPLLYGDRLYFLRHLYGIITCLEAQSGKPLFGPSRIRGLHSVFASPVGAADRVYITGRSGTTTVMKNSNEYEILATNYLDDSFTASPAIAGKELFLRGEQYLYCIAE
jgi:outer membrane protein assembly factor BamB